MKYNIFVSKSVEKFFKKHPKFKEKFKKKVQILSNSENWKNLDFKKMFGYENDYRLRIGKYRFLAVINKEKILIYFYKADSRGSSYK